MGFRVDECKIIIVCRCIPEVNGAFCVPVAIVSPGEIKTAVHFAHFYCVLGR